MAESPALDEFLDRARKVFGMAASLGRDLEEARGGGDLYEGGAAPPQRRERQRLSELAAAVRDLADQITSPPAGGEQVAPRLREADKLARKLERTNDWDLSDHYPELNTISESGFQAVREAREAARNDEDESFLDGADDAEGEHAEIEQAKPNPLARPVSFRLDMAEHFDPLHTTDTGLWRQSLLNVRERFTAAASNHDQLTCVLAHTAVPAWPPETDIQTLIELAGMEFAASGSGPRREPVQIFERIEDGKSVLDAEFGKRFKAGWDLVIVDNASEFRSKDGTITYRPAVGEKPVINVDGKPMLYPDGKPAAVRLGVGRTHSIYAHTAARDRHGSHQQFRSAATDAGRILYGIPSGVNRVLWRDWLDGFLEIDNEAMWINALFELAWQRIPGSPLSAERFAWHGTTTVPLDALPRLRKSEHMASELAAIPDPPVYWYSVIENLAAASVAAIDILLAIGDQIESKPAASSHSTDAGGAEGAPEGASKTSPDTPPEPPVTVEQLEQDTPSLDKENPDLWAKPGDLKTHKETASTKSLREQRSAGKKLADNSFGVCKAGRIWRKEGRDTWYYVPSLLPKRDKAQPLIADALRLISTVD